MKNFYFVSIALLTVFLVSCEKDKDNNNDPIPVLHGTFIINEGSYGSGNGSVSFLSSDGSYFSQDLFFSANNLRLGDIVQSMKIYNSKGYIVVNNSHKVEVVSMQGFESIGTITGFSSPRYFLPLNSSKAYVSDWNSGTNNEIKIVNLNSLSITGSIAVGAGPEQMVISNGKVYVGNGGGLSVDSTVSVIDPATNTVIKTIQVGVNPASMLIDNDGKLLVLCSGSTGTDYIAGTADDLSSKLIVIDPATDNIISSFSIGQLVHPVKMTSNGAKNKIYILFGNDGYSGVIAELNTFSGTITNLGSERFYGLGINPDNGYIYAGRGGFSADCYMLRYTENAQLIDSMLVGIGPNSCVFN
ncbi:MAG: YncE family protein [Bacteroidota bacterium]